MAHARHVQARGDRFFVLEMEDVHGRILDQIGSDPDQLLTTIATPTDMWGSSSGSRIRQVLQSSEDKNPKLRPLTIHDRVEHTIMYYI